MKIAPTCCRQALAIFGTFPPPYGGVSVHLQRVLPYLEKSGIDYIFYNTGASKVKDKRVLNIGWSIPFLLKIFFCSAHRVVHFHTSRWWVRACAAIMHKATKCRIIFTAHGASLIHSITHKNVLVRTCARWTLKQSDHVIATNENIKKALICEGISPERITILPAFIPPPSDSSKIPHQVFEYCQHHSPVLMASAGFPSKRRGDVYGIDTLQHCILDMALDFPTIGLVVFLPERGKKRTYVPETSTSRSHHFYLHSSQDEFYPALPLCDLFLRPTTTDGDANSVREALAAGVPVVASDVVPRPDGCLTYPAGSSVALKSAVKAALENSATVRKSASKNTTMNPAIELIHLYEKLLNAHT